MRSVRAFITGIGGFAGSHLAEALVQEKNRVEGTVPPGEPTNNIDHLISQLTLHPVDIRSSESLAEAIRKAKPDVVYHLAATSSVSEGERNPTETMEVNLTGTLHLLEAIRTEAPGARLVYVSSSEVYGKVLPEENPVGEDRPLAPVHAYGLSKLLAEQVVRFYQRLYGISAVILRPFNHIGPRQSDQFVCPSFVKQLVWIESGRAEPVIHVGNLDPVRDFTDVRDMVKAYRLAAEHCNPGSLYNVASGEGISIADLLNEILSLINACVEVREDPDRVRKTEIPLLTGDATSFRQATGWQRRFQLRDSLKGMLAYWRQQATDLADG
jgi:GDP-4-dehydro-6-deoxy-D-mannose reductase